jgi:distribution and morphology protein 31
MSLPRWHSTLRPLLRNTPVASSSRATSRNLWTGRSAQSDRYLTIHAFFTRQAIQLEREQATLNPRFGRSHKRLISTEGQKPCPNCDKSVPTSPNPHAPVNAHRYTPGKDHAQDYTPFIRRLIARSKSLAAESPHRPTKDELLAAASSWWQRLRIRIKWFTIRGWRRFNTDDLSAFASWFVVGNTLWILIGTTTFVSAVFATLNSLSLQEYVARWISDYLTSNTGVTVM